jgi:predicted RNA-binding protein with RPS1 domain
MAERVLRDARPQVGRPVRVGDLCIHPRFFMNSVATESFAELFEQSQTNWAKIKPGAIVKGIVVDVRNDVVVINAGLKSEGIVPIEQFRNDAGEIDVGIGDEVKVALDSLENGFGETVLSREKAKRAMVWDELEEALEANATIVGRISGKVKGGFTVDIKDVRAFLPGSLVDVRPVRDPVYLEGKELEFKLIKLDRKRNNVVVSRRAVVESEHSEEREQLLEKLVEGAVLKGVVKNLTDYGAFVDLGGIDGLLHITDMAWKRVRHPSEVVEVGAELDVRVLKYDRERNRVSLGLKQLGEDPWDNIARRYPSNSRVFGKVSNVTDYGAFVEIEPGVEGLVHVSEMDWTNKNVNPAKVVQVGDEVRGHGAGRGRGASPHLAGHQAGHQQPVGDLRRDPQEERQGVRPDQVDHRLRHLHRPGRRHRRPDPPVRHQLELHRRRHRPQLQEGRYARGGGAGGGPGARAHQLGVKQMEQDPLGQFMAANAEGHQGHRHRQGSGRQGCDHRPGRWRRGLRDGPRHRRRARRGCQPVPEGRPGNRGQVRGHGPQGPQPAALDQGQGRGRDRRGDGRVQQGRFRRFQRHHQAGCAAARAADSKSE